MSGKKDIKKFGDLNLFRTAGQPRTYNTPEAMAKVIHDYFNSFIPPDPKPYEWRPPLGTRPTVTGLTLYLGFCDKKSLRDYKTYPEYSPLIRMALTLVEMSYEELLSQGKGAGPIFALKNMGWKDQIDVITNESTETGEPIFDGIEIIVNKVDNNDEITD